MQRAFQGQFVRHLRTTAARRKDLTEATPVVQPQVQAPPPAPTSSSLDPKSLLLGADRPPVDKYGWKEKTMAFAIGTLIGCGLGFVQLNNDIVDGRVKSEAAVAALRDDVLSEAARLRTRLEAIERTLVPPPSQSEPLVSEAASDAVVSDAIASS